MRPLHRLARRRRQAVLPLLAAELERQGWFALESQLSGGARPAELARRRERGAAKADAELLAVWLAATSLPLDAATPVPLPRGRRRPTAVWIGLLLETARHALRFGQEDVFSALLALSEAEVERARKLGIVSPTEADDWGDRAYLLLGWQARRSGLAEQVQDVLDAFAAPVPLERSLVTQAWAFHLLGMSAADRGDVRTARRLLRRAFDVLPNPAVLFEVDLAADYAEVLAATGHRKRGAELLAETVAIAGQAWPPALLVRLGLRAVELLAASGRQTTVLFLESLQADVPAGPEAEFFAVRAEICLAAGALRGARALFARLRATEPRGSGLSLRAAVGLARVAAAEGRETEARAGKQALAEDLAALASPDPRRPALLAALGAFDDEDLSAALADVHAWLRVLRDAPAVPFRRPFPGAVPLPPRTEPPAADETVH